MSNVHFARAVLKNIPKKGTIALVSDGGRAYVSQNLYDMNYMCPVRPTMTIIATTFLNLPFANRIMNAFDEFSNEYEFTADGVFRRTNSPVCPCCGKQMNHNGYNRYSILDLANIKLGRYICKNGNISSHEKNTFWENMNFEFNQIFMGLYQVLRNHDVSFEGVS